MLSFELSAIDLILLIAVIVLLVLYITRLSARPPTEEKLSVGEGSLKKGERNLLSTQPETDYTKCPYSFGYLEKLDKNASVPNECLSCPRITECSGLNE